jgi:large subunit ribosomal protein L6
MTDIAQQAVVRTSRVGKIPVVIPKGVTIAVSNRTVEVTGAKGTLSLALPSGTSLSLENDRVLVSAASGPGSARMQGLVRALVANMVRGTTDGFQKTLLLVGTGYRAEVKGSELHMVLGLSHPVVFAIPDGISMAVPKDSKGTQIVITGADRCLVGQTAARVRDARPPEPYGGKGVRYQGEQVREKAGKAGKGSKGAR